VVTTSLTTAGGLASFAAAELEPIAQLGVYAPAGVLFALVYTLVLLPALLALFPSAARRRGSGRAGGALSRALEGAGDFAATHPWSVVCVAAALLAAAALGTPFLRFSHDPLDWFPEQESVRTATRLIDARLDGVNAIELLVHTGVENGVQDPRVLERLEALQREAARVNHGDWHVGKAVSIADVVKEIHQALNEGRPEFHAIPPERRLVAQELLLFESAGSDDLEDLVDPLFTTARVTLRVPWMDAVAYPALLDELAPRLRGALGEGLALEITGLVPVLSRTFRAVLESMARSYATALLVITPLVVWLVGHLGRGLLCMIPNLAPVVVMLGAMGWAGLPVDGITMMVGAIVMGLADDDTIHFMHNFRRHHEQSGDSREAIRHTLRTTGRALLVTSLVLAAGFFTFTAAYLRSIQLFGWLAGCAILVAFAANLLLAPALMTLATRAPAPAPEGFSPVAVRPMRPAMAGGDPRRGEIEVTPEERRFLERFFRRQVWPWFAGAVAIAVACAFGLRGAPPDDEALEVRTAAALAQLRSENERLRAAVAELEGRVGEALAAPGRQGDELERRVEDARRDLQAMEARVAAALEERLAALESRVAAAPARTDAAARPSAEGWAPEPEAYPAAPLP
jgi:predicted RND superfamily exporter protein